MKPKPSWQIRRSGVTQRDGSQRWDQAYQLLLRWASASEAGTPETPIYTTEEEPHDGSGSLCPSLHQTATTVADD
jgi:hypothetical protein